jgi:hypothetical protein
MNPERDNVSIYISELTKAAEEAKEKKRGIYNKRRESKSV